MSKRYKILAGQDTALGLVWAGCQVLLKPGIPTLGQ